MIREAFCFIFMIKITKKSHNIANLKIWFAFLSIISTQIFLKNKSVFYVLKSKNQQDIKIVSKLKRKQPNEQNQKCLKGITTDNEKIERIIRPYF